MISIIIPFYNTEKYIDKCLSSVKGQTFSDYEVLMVDDGSNDNSRKIAESYLVDKRFKLLGKEHIGFPYAKNIGLDNAKGEYIAFLDSDDYYEPQCLEYLYKSLIDNNADISCCRYTSFTNEPDEKNYNTINTKITTDKMGILFNNVGSSFMWNKLYKKELFENIRFKNVVALSDTMTTYLLFDKAKVVSMVFNVLVNHRVHNENMTYRVKHFEPTYWEHRLNVYLDMCGFIVKHYKKNKKLAQFKLQEEIGNIRLHFNMIDKYNERINEILNE